MADSSISCFSVSGSPQKEPPACYTGRLKYTLRLNVGNSMCALCVCVVFCCCCWRLWHTTPLSAKLQLYRSVSFIGEWSRSTRRKPPSCHKSLTNFITWCCIEYTSPRVGFELTFLVEIGTDCTASCKSNYHMITTAPPFVFGNQIYQPQIL